MEEGDEGGGGSKKTFSNVNGFLTPVSSTSSIREIKRVSFSLPLIKSTDSTNDKPITSPPEFFKNESTEEAKLKSYFKETSTDDLFTPARLYLIKHQLDHYKLNGMSVHPGSANNTHLFNQHTFTTKLNQNSNGYNDHNRGKGKLLYEVSQEDIEALEALWTNNIEDFNEDCMLED